MRDAAVGFQCPSCVAEGAKQTRQNRTAFGGIRPTDTTATSLVLIGVNGAVWVAVLLADVLLPILGIHTLGFCRFGGGDTVVPTGANRREACLEQGGTWLPGVLDGAYWQVLTSAFTHQAFFHIVLNMLALYLLGPRLEGKLGRARFLTLYLGSAVWASVVVYWATEPFALTIGASGAVFGMLGARLMLAYKSREQPENLLILVAIMVVLSFSAPNISWQGHLGGLLGGALIGGVLVYAPRERRATLQAIGVGTVMTLAVVAIAARSLTF